MRLGVGLALTDFGTRGGVADAADRAYWTGAIHAALGTSITFQGQYTTPLAQQIGTTLTNQGVSGATLSVGGSNNGNIYNQVASIADPTDLITIEAGINDFRLNVPLGTIADTTTATFYGAVNKAITDIIAVEPFRQIVLFTPYGNTDTNYTGNYAHANDIGVNLTDYVQAIKDVAALFPNVRVADVYTDSGIGGLTAATYMSDGIHLNSTGGQVYSNYVAGIINTIVRPTPGSALDPSNKGSGATLSNRNRDLTVSAASWSSARTTQVRSSGAYYYEAKLVTLADATATIAGLVNTASAVSNTFPGGLTNSWGARGLGQLVNGFTAVAFTTFTPVVGDIFMIAADITNGSVWFGRNGTWNQGVTPVSGSTTGRNASFQAGMSIHPVVGCAAVGNKVRVRTVQREMTYSPPSGFTVWG